MLKFTNIFRINGKPMFAPDADIAISYSDLDSEDSGRDEAGFMHRIVIRRMMGTWSFSFFGITEEEKRYMESLFDGLDEFDLTHPDRLDAEKEVTTRCYRSKYSITWHNARTGLWRNYKFNIIEC